MSENRSPWLRSHKTGTQYSADVIAALLCLVIFSFFCYGWRPVILTALSALSAVFCELLGNAARHQRPTVFDGTALITGMMIGLLMSPITAYWVPVLASAFAIIVVKIPFGGLGHNVFNPAAAGVALATQCFPTRVFSYSDAASNTLLPLNGIPEDIITRLSPAAELAAGAKTGFSLSDILWGEISGPIGATAILVLLAAAVFLFIRGTASPLITLPFFATCALIALCFPRSSEGNALYNMALELCAGYLLFAGIFLLNDPVTSPKTPLARVIFGVLAGILVMLMRHNGRFEENACFAILLMNALCAPIDRLCWRITYAYHTRKRGGTR